MIISESKYPVTSERKQGIVLQNGVKTMKKSGNVTKKDSDMSQLQRARKNAGLTQNEVIKILSGEYHITYKREEMSLWENGKRKPSENVIDCLAKIYNVRPEYLEGKTPWPTWDDLLNDQAQKEDEYIQSCIVPYVTFLFSEVGIALKADEKLSFIQEISRAVYNMQSTENGRAQKNPVSIDNEIFFFTSHDADGKEIRREINGKKFISDICQAYHVSSLIAGDFQNLIKKMILPQE